MKNTNEPRNILFVHQSADLYGSDKALIATLLSLDKKRFKPIVLLPKKGPLYDELIKLEIIVFDGPICVLGRASLTAKGFLKLIQDLFVGQRTISIISKTNKVDIVYSNTLAVLSGSFWSFINRKPHIWHVHEILVGPTVVRRIFSILLQLTTDQIICVSDAVKRNLLQFGTINNKKIKVIWNGISGRSIFSKNDCYSRVELGLIADSLVITLVGRINRLKGQLVLIRAAEILLERGVNNFSILIVGGPPPGQEHYLTSLNRKINESSVASQIKLLPYVKDIYSIWDITDIAVVPSTEPESFGLVALEAMSASKPVIASALGGIVEIIEDGVTGILVPHNDPISLANAIERMIRVPNAKTDMGIAGKARFEQFFTSKQYAEKIRATLEAI